MLSLDYIAGAIDCDGSISISYRKRDKVYIFSVNFRQLEDFEYLLKEIQETLGVGSIYHHVERMLTWQTTKTRDAKLVCEILLPYLRIKRPQAERLLEAISKWESYRRHEISKEEVVRCIESIRRDMNVNRQTTTSRRNRLGVAA